MSPTKILKPLNVLVACEESQAVCLELRALGHNAYSCDILPSSGGHPEYHLESDVLEVLRAGLDWDLVISFPPCTHLACSGAAWFAQKRLDGRQQEGIDFFLEFTKLSCPWAIENPVGIMSKTYRKPDQIIHPYYFGDKASKKTCLWLNKLPKLKHDPSNYVEGSTYITSSSGSGRRYPDWFWYTGKGCSTQRSKTYPGIAKAMALQWSEYLLSLKS